jgi:hypothetical protein
MEDVVLRITVRPEDYEVLQVIRERCPELDQTNFIQHIINEYEIKVEEQ